MAEISIDFYSSEGIADSTDFEANSGLLEAIADYAEDIDCDEWHIVGSDLDYSLQKDYGDFDNLNEWGEYCENVEKHGYAYVLRYDDIGEFDFDNEYNGCYDSEEDFVQALWDDCYNIPDFICGYIDWESVTRDVMMDYSSYYGNEGYYIFRD